MFKIRYARIKIEEIVCECRDLDPRADYGRYFCADRRAVFSIHCEDLQCCLYSKVQVAIAFPTGVRTRSRAY